MKFRINFEHSSGDADSLVVSGATVEECQAEAEKELKSRGIDPETAWSQELPE